MRYRGPGACLLKVNEVAGLLEGALLAIVTANSGAKSPLPILCLHLL
jgi:hypothetical protein